MTTVATVDSFFESERVRIVFDDDDIPYWVCKDACEAMGISKYRDAMAQLDEDERVSQLVDTPGGKQTMVCVTEAGLFALMLISRSPNVRPFRRWVTHEVLPTIRKYGIYGMKTPSALTEDEIVHQALSITARRVEELTQKVKELEPSANAWDVLAAAEGDYGVRDAAKILSRDPDIITGERRLFGFMHYSRWVFRGSNNRWRAYQAQVNCGRLVERIGQPFEIEGEMRLPEPTVRITAKGLRDLHAMMGGSGEVAILG